MAKQTKPTPKRIKLRRSRIRIFNAVCSSEVGANQGQLVTHKAAGIDLVRQQTQLSELRSGRIFGEFGITIPKGIQNVGPSCIRRRVKKGNCPPYARKALNLLMQTSWSTHRKRIAELSSSLSHEGDAGPNDRRTRLRFDRQFRASAQITASAFVASLPGQCDFKCPQQRSLSA